MVTYPLVAVGDVETRHPLLQWVPGFAMLCAVSKNIFHKTDAESVDVGDTLKVVNVMQDTIETRIATVGRINHSNGRKRSFFSVSGVLIDIYEPGNGHQYYTQPKHPRLFE